MKAEIKIPSKLSEVPLMSYQKYLQVLKGSNDEEFIAHKFLQIFLGLELKEAYKIAAKDVARLVKHMTDVLEQPAKFQPRFKIHNVEYGFITDIENMTWGEYIDLENNLQNWDTYHIAMSVMYRPIIKEMKSTKTYEIMPYEVNPDLQEAMKYAPIDVVKASSVFFWNLETELLNATLSSLEQQIMEMKISVQSHNSQINGDGTTAYTDWLKMILEILNTSQPYLSINALPSWSTKSSKKKSKQILKDEHLINSNDDRIL
jgi:hypothetical protein